MKNETYKIELPGSQPYAKLVTYIQDDSAEIGIASRPLKRHLTEFRFPAPHRNKRRQITL